MKKLLLPLLLGLIGTGGGVAAAIFLAPAAEEDHAAAAPGPCGDIVGEEVDEARAVADADEGAPADTPPEGRSYARLNNQFVVPVVENGQVSALVLLSMTVEVVADRQELVFQHEPRLRDEFLQVLFDHANAGGFEGVFTATANLTPLRRALRTTARRVVGPEVLDVLITDLVRQDHSG